jgi:hypothetical protein
MSAYVLTQAVSNRSPQPGAYFLRCLLSVVPRRRRLTTIPCDRYTGSSSANHSIRPVHSPILKPVAKSQQRARNHYVSGRVLRPFYCLDSCCTPSMHHSLAELDILNCATGAIHWSDAEGGPRTNHRAHTHTDTYPWSMPRSTPNYRIIPRYTCKAASFVGRKWLYERIVFADRSMEEFIPPRISIGDRIDDRLTFCKRDGDILSHTKWVTVVCCRDHPRSEDHSHGAELAQAAPSWLTSKVPKTVTDLLARSSTVVKLEINMGLSGGVPEVPSSSGASTPSPLPSNASVSPTSKTSHPPSSSTSRPSRRVVYPTPLAQSDCTA